jgi:gliding motility-associated-like protein
VNEDAEKYLNDPAIAEPTFDASQLTENDSVMVTLNVNNTYCEASDSLVLEKWDGFVPSGFTPNGDGINDVWRFDIGKDKYIDVKIEVFNRWGERVFMSEEYQDTWDGTRNGNKLPVGTYYYVITVDDGNQKQKISGALTIIR